MILYCTLNVYNTQTDTHPMLVFGTCNPDGENDTHKGVYLRKNDISSLVNTGALIHLPVKIEHVGQPVGHIVSAWQHGGRLDCVLKINDNSIDGICAQEFVQSRKCPELSLSYSVTMQHSNEGISGGSKDMIEVSIVGMGARKNCHIHGFSKK
jgi:hypothetical protein